MSQQWHGGKGSCPRTASREITKEEHDLRDKLWRAPAEEKPTILARIEELQTARLKKD